MSYSDQLSSEQQQEYREVWDHFDVGKTGSLAPKEYAVLMRAVGEDVSEQQASSMGASISFNEFLANRQAKWAAQQAGDVVKHAFRVLDRRGQGFVDAQDLRRLLSSLGERLSSSEVEELLRDAGGGNQINYNDFVDKMMKKKN